MKNFNISKIKNSFNTPIKKNFHFCSKLEFFCYNTHRRNDVRAQKELSGTRRLNPKI